MVVAVSAPALPRLVLMEDLVQALPPQEETLAQALPLSALEEVVMVLAQAPPRLVLEEMLVQVLPLQG